MKYVSIDIETTGLDDSYCQILEVAAVLADTTDARTPLDELPKFKCRLYYDRVVGEPYALKLNAELIGDMDKRPNAYNYLHPDSVANAFQDWARYHGVGKAWLAGKNVGTFDLRFLRRLKHWNAESMHHHRVIDPSMYYFDPLKDDKLPDTKECIQRAGLVWDSKRLHSAYEDAMLVVELIRRGPTVMSQYLDKYVAMIERLVTAVPFEEVVP